jgi:amino acid transporter
MKVEVKKKAFGLWSAVAKLAIRYPSRGGITEYLVQGFGENLFSGTMSIMFYFAQLVAIAAVAKSFGTYASTLMSGSSPFWINFFSVGVLMLFTFINLIGASSVAKAENIIVMLKLSVLIIFSLVALFTIDVNRLGISNMPPMDSMLFAIGLTFFAYQGFSVITNTVEDMENPKVTMMKSMIWAILLVALLYIVTSIAVLGNLSLDEVMKSQDYALAEASKPILGELGFKR